MTATIVDPSEVARAYRDEVSSAVAALVERGRSLRVVGILSQDDGPAATYARYARKGCEAVGIAMEVRHVGADEVEAAIAAANADRDVDGIFLYYPLMDAAADRWLRELVDPRKDIEGMHSFWSRLLYENRRFVDDDGAKRAILPCTPLAILKLLQHAGMRGEGSEAPLEGLTACVVNRSDIVGRPLAAMLANDGARVHSLDVHGSLLLEPAIGRHTHDVRDSTASRAEALAEADVVVSAVPAPAFEPITGAELKPGALLVNVAERRNFDDSALEVASAFVPRVGPLTVTMATRNLVRLVETLGR
ncbi:bifunctional methylenetetrahydrofolate dehydrogenase/methenyltetrahydrofolate cyclohydrolase [Agrococcus sp. SGAir0287]|uniref:bifunctional methylenetetrahydrofolate dehydrogenase/methenyltetrahydrofolate cyclohydrolase n=1 Tax=Agrococcus sp. SGAir0287 TaxID=2070347 RepID=UPI0010CD5736|nr:bifunctional methylenetetrahydrofolate dehydrogenase/methenyltetrahydrofolate cyclohydrolase [Agrococcus sp. SGAir0287]QCR20172.1 methylenetetrahydrofolate dehydrogenase [Agrococcus sp. SGAir0287]